MTTTPLFDHRDSGTPESDWQQALERLPRLTLPDRGRLVVVAAHPDDETLGAGGLIAAAADAGLSVTVLVATAGEASHPGSPTHTAHDLARIRHGEVFDAVTRLAPTAAIRQLGLPDGRLADHRPVLESALAEIIDADTVLVTPFFDDRHPDHTAAAEAAHDVVATTGARHWQYPIWLWHWGSPADLDSRPWQRLDLPPAVLQRKRSAMATHRSQVVPLSDAPGDESILTPGMLAHFRRDHEVFLTDRPLPRPEDIDFEAFWANAEADPWGYRDRWYEERKRAVLLAALPRRRFRSVFEPACATGHLTVELAARADHVLATDLSEVPLRQARELLAGHPGVDIMRSTMPRDWPEGRFDLVVLSEIGYYLSAADWSETVRRAVSALDSDGVIVACHWRHPVPESAATGDEVHRALRRDAELRVLVEHVEPDFRLTVLGVSGAPTPAEAEVLS